MGNLIILAIAGLVAQLVDGSLGMGFGVTSSTLLIAAGIAPAMASASIHFAELGTTLVSGFSHHKMGNVDWRIVSVLAAPGGIGAFFGAHFLVSLPAELARPWVAGLLFLLGVYVIWRFLVLSGRRPALNRPLPVAFLAPVGLVGGTLDAVGGGGWGPVGTTALLSSGRLTPRKAVGSVSAAEFVVALGGSLGFLLALGEAGINAGFVVALLAGGIIAAPLAAWLVRHLPSRILGVAAGSLILLTNSRTVLESLGAPGPAVGLAAGCLAAVCAVLIWRAARQEKRSRGTVHHGVEGSAVSGAALMAEPGGVGTEERTDLRLHPVGPPGPAKELQEPSI